LSSFFPSFFGVPSFLFCTSIKEGRKELLTSSSFFWFQTESKIFLWRWDRLAPLSLFSRGVAEKNSHKLKCVHKKTASPKNVGESGDPLRPIIFLLERKCLRRYFGGLK
jgi:hypothetical protein